MLVTSFNFLFLLAGTGGDNDDEEVIIIAVDDDGNEEDTNDKDDDNDGNALSSSSILFSKTKIQIVNGSAILWNDCVFIPIRSRVGGGVYSIAHPDHSVPQFCWAIAHFYSQF